MAPRTAVQRHTVRPACGRRAQGGREKGTKRRRAAQKNGVDVDCWMPGSHAARTRMGSVHAAMAHGCTCGVLLRQRRAPIDTCAERQQARRSRAQSCIATVSSRPVFRPYLPPDALHWVQRSRSDCAEAAAPACGVLGAQAARGKLRAPKLRARLRGGGAAAAAAQHPHLARRLAPQAACRRGCSTRPRVADRRPRPRFCACLLWVAACRTPTCRCFTRPSCWLRLRATWRL
jgi:hypothetical protein